MASISPLDQFRNYSEAQLTAEELDEFRKKCSLFTRQKKLNEQDTLIQMHFGGELPSLNRIKKVIVPLHQVLTSQLAVFEEELKSQVMKQLHDVSKLLAPYGGITGIAIWL